MKLWLQVVSYRGAPPAAAIAWCFGSEGGGIGRTADNELVLPDPDRIVSRRHARIVWRDGAFEIEDVGGNATIVNGQALAGARRFARLESGDELSIGDYLLKARVELDDEPRPETVPDAGAFDALGALPDPLYGEAAPPDPGPFQRSVGDDVAPQALPFVPAAIIPEDYDPLASRIASRAAAAAAPVTGAVAGPVAARASAPVSSPVAAPAGPVAPDRAAADAVPSPVATAAAARSDPTLAALMRGLGLADLPLGGASGPQVAEACGQMLRVAMGGIMQTLAARAIAKNEVRIDMTLVAVRDNNPLKFFPDVASALAQMITGRGSGYQPAVRAIGEAFDDVRAHEVAMMAGMRATLAAVLERLDPRAIERAKGAGSTLDRLIAPRRKAALWDRLVEAHGEIAHAADRDFEKLFRERFGAAYADQIDRLGARH
ncbi:MAG TPA: type VI secretion system-associated FHA domain protein TagH [Burkholderiaceae bacterium]|nr:type VI secretion system-associated FHA domain protein TagH [Burkholderiaceae bacterium]